MHGAELGFQPDWANARVSLPRERSARGMASWALRLAAQPARIRKGGRLLFVMPPPTDLRRRETIMCDKIQAMSGQIADRLRLRALYCALW
jgi:hypothetical protein